MKFNLRKGKLTTGIIFFVTLSLGVVALAMAWRLQQEKQITEEEAAAYEATYEKYWDWTFWCVGELKNLGQGDVCVRRKSSDPSTYNDNLYSITRIPEPSGEGACAGPALGPQPPTYSSCVACDGSGLPSKFACQYKTDANLQVVNNVYSSMGETCVSLQMDQYYNGYGSAASFEDGRKDCANCTSLVLADWEGNDLVVTATGYSDLIKTTYNPNSSGCSGAIGDTRDGCATIDLAASALQFQFKLNVDGQPEKTVDVTSTCQPDTSIGMAQSWGVLGWDPRKKRITCDAAYTFTDAAAYAGGTITAVTRNPFAGQTNWSAQVAACQTNVPEKIVTGVDCVRKIAVTNNSPTVGDEVTYSVSYSYSGITDGFITITDTLDSRRTGDVVVTTEGLTMVTDKEFNELSAGECKGGAVKSGSIFLKKLVCKIPVTTQSGSGTLTYKTNIIASGTVTNSAKVSGGGMEDGTGCTAVFDAVKPSAICTQKTISTGESEIDPGQQVTFRVSYRNNGTVPGTVVVTDNVPLAFNITSVSQGCTYTANVVTCRITNVAAGATGNIQIVATAASDIRNYSDDDLTNSATVNIDRDDDGKNDGENSVCTVGVTTSIAGMACVAKTASPEGPVNPGDLVTYTVTYTVENGPVEVPISETVPQYLDLQTDDVIWCEGSQSGDACRKDFDDYCTYDTTSRLLDCLVTEKAVGDYEHNFIFFAIISDSGVPVGGADVTNLITVGTDEGGDTCEETIEVEHESPVCEFVDPRSINTRIGEDGIELTATGGLGTHESLEFRWVLEGSECGSLSSGADSWHDASNGTDQDTITWMPPTDVTGTPSCSVQAYVRPDGSDDETGITADECVTVLNITDLDLYCEWLSPNNPFGVMPFDMTFAANIVGTEDAAYTYDLDFGDGSTHYTGDGTVGAVGVIEHDYIPPQSSPHTYDSATPQDFEAVLTVVNTATDEESICTAPLGTTTQSEWTIVKDSDVDTCVAQNTTVDYTIVVTNAGDYTADLEEVRDTIDAKIDSSTITNIRACDSSGTNCTTYNRADVVSGHTIIWPGRTFAPGESRRYTYTVTVSTAGDYYNVAEAVPATGNIVRDDEVFPTCAPGAPTTGGLSCATYALILGVMMTIAGIYFNQTKRGAQLIANVMGKSERGLWRLTHKKEAFERDVVRSSKKRE